MEKLENLDHNPLLKQLLKNYVLRMYEADAETDDWSLWQEYLLLIRENNLQAIFENECLTNKFIEENLLYGNGSR
jgi:hypothetical protein